jgi:hypothetical protein
MAAVAAVRKPGEEDVVAWGETSHSGPDLLDDPGPFVAEDDGKIGRMNALRDMQVGVADTTRRQPDLQLARLRRVELELLDNERLLEGAKDGCSH